MPQKPAMLNAVHLHNTPDDYQLCCSQAAATNLREPGQFCMKASDPTLALLDVFQLPSRDLQANWASVPGTQSKAFVGKVSS